MEMQGELTIVFHCVIKIKGIVVFNLLFSDLLNSLS
jgi:hypothetical protein